MTSLLTKDIGVTVDGQRTSSILYNIAMDMGKLASTDNLCLRLYGEESFSSFSGRMLDIQNEIFVLLKEMEEAA